MVWKLFGLKPLKKTLKNTMFWKLLRPPRDPSPSCTQFFLHRRSCVAGSSQSWCPGCRGLPAGRPSRGQKLPNHSVFEGFWDPQGHATLKPPGKHHGLERFQAFSLSQGYPGRFRRGLGLPGSPDASGEAESGTTRRTLNP